MRSLVNSYPVCVAEFTGIEQADIPIFIYANDAFANMLQSSPVSPPPRYSSLNMV